MEPEDLPDNSPVLRRNLSDPRRPDSETPADHPATPDPATPDPAQQLDPAQANPVPERREAEPPVPAKTTPNRLDCAEPTHESPETADKPVADARRPEETLPQESLPQESLPRESPSQEQLPDQRLPEDVPAVVVATPAATPEPAAEPVEAAVEDTAGTVARIQPDGRLRKLHPNYIPAEYLGAMIGALVVAAIVATIIIVTMINSWLTGVGLWIEAGTTILLGTLLIVWGFLHPRLSYRHTRYAFSAIGLEIRRGILWKTITSVPRNRVQHVDVTQGPIAKRYQLATLSIHTAGTEQNVVELPGVGYDDALAIRDFLVGRVTSDDIGT